MASYPWEQNVGADQVGDVRAGGGGGGGLIDHDTIARIREAASHPERALHRDMGQADARPEDYSDYGAGGPGLTE